MKAAEALAALRAEERGILNAIRKIEAARAEIEDLLGCRVDAMQDIHTGRITFERRP